MEFWKIEHVFLVLKLVSHKQNPCSFVAKYGCKLLAFLRNANPAKYQTENQIVHFLRVVVSDTTLSHGFEVPPSSMLEMESLLPFFLYCTATPFLEIEH